MTPTEAQMKKARAVYAEWWNNSEPNPMWAKGRLQLLIAQALAEESQINWPSEEDIQVANIDNSAGMGKLTSEGC